LIFRNVYRELQQALAGNQFIKPQPSAKPDDSGQSAPLEKTGISDTATTYSPDSFAGFFSGVLV